MGRAPITSVERSRDHGVARLPRSPRPDRRGAMTFSESERAAMRRALALAASDGVPLGPNPRVGCVLLDADGRAIAEGYHRGAGTPHAEVDALAQVGGSAPGATAVVTLEPCNHTGRTGPCSPGVGRGRRTAGGDRPARPQPGRGRRRRDPARRRRRGRDRAAAPTRRAPSTGSGPSPSSTAGRSSPGSSPPPSTAAAPPPTAPAAGSPARPPASTRTDCGPCATRCWSAPAPSRSTTRT